MLSNLSVIKVRDPLHRGFEMRDAALNDPHPHASLKAGWLAGSLALALAHDSTLFFLFASSVHLGYGNTVRYKQQH